MFDKIKDLKKLRDQAKEIQSALDDMMITTTSSDGSVKILMNANMEIKECTITGEHDNEHVAQKIKETINTAIKEAQQRAADYMRTSGGLNFPGLS